VLLLPEPPDDGRRADRPSLAAATAGTRAAHGRLQRPPLGQPRAAACRSRRPGHRRACGAVPPAGGDVTGPPRTRLSGLLAARKHLDRPRYRADPRADSHRDRKSTRLNSSHVAISYAVFCLKKKKKKNIIHYLINYSINIIVVVYII